MSSTVQTSPVSLSLSALRNQDQEPIPASTLLEAFGPTSLGILLVSDLPPHFPALRSRVLAKISHLAHLPAAQLDKLVNDEAKYLVGWSHGKESLREGVVDWLKGSYYVNTAFNENDAVVEKMRQDWSGFNEYTASNVWPDESLVNEYGEKGLEGFRRDVEELVSLIVDVAGWVARAVDAFGESNVENWPSSTTTDENQRMGYLEAVVRGSRTSKARLLHYFPSNPEASSSGDGSNGVKTDADGPADAEDSWCTTHKDHSCLTGLTSAAFYDETPSSAPSTTTTTTTTTTTSSSSSTQAYNELPTPPSPTSGLYIQSRTSEIHKISIPRSSLAFQTGEALELITQGKLKAVPHFVRGVDSTHSDNRMIARNTLAVFTQPNLSDVIDLERGITFGQFAGGVVGKNTA